MKKMEQETRATALNPSLLREVISADLMSYVELCFDCYLALVGYLHH